MIHFDLPKDQSSIIKVIGVGGGGGNAVNHMYGQNIEGVDFIICNTDAQAISLSKVPNKIQLGPHLTQGLGAGANPSVGRQATEESLEEIKRILEVNTKMAFITAGMGGGTGTGGAPIVAKICKDLGILTVGIVTTPFAYEGKKRIAQAELGLEQLKDSVDTLLVISNDKLRHQFGNLKMKEAFAKADNVLATAAKCITDVINSTGQINVDFADVCNVMKNGGVAILGSAMASGENRAQQAIEEALNSPLLNDNDIKGARSILININSSNGEHEFALDEVEVIQAYLLDKAGDDADVFLGLGYDETLGENIGITVIATGFERKDPFGKETNSTVQVESEKVVNVLEAQTNEEQPAVTFQNGTLFDVDAVDKVIPTPTVLETPVVTEITIAPTVTALQTSIPLPEEQATVAAQPIAEEIATPIVLQIQPEEVFVQPIFVQPVAKAVDDEVAPEVQQLAEPIGLQPLQHAQEHSDMGVAASAGHLRKPSQIYASEAPNMQPIVQQVAPQPTMQTAPMQTSAAQPVPQAESISTAPTLVYKEEVEEVAQPFTLVQKEVQISTQITAEQMAAEDEKRRAAERIAKLRKLSFNMSDPNNEYEMIPAYLRRAADMTNSIASVESFYSNYQVQTDENNKTEINTLNTFLSGNKPD